MDSIFQYNDIPAVKQLTHGFDYLHLLLVLVAVLLGVLHVIHNFKKYIRNWKARHIKKVWGIKDGDSVTVICSERDKPEKLQNPEPREFIYNLKYGDIDAYFEVVITLLRLYPNIRLRIMSAGEAARMHFNMKQNLVLIGGPDYNSYTNEILNKGITQYKYLINEIEDSSTQVVLYDSRTKRKLCAASYEKDYGYLERIPNPYEPKKNIILIGGCHTIGVTGAVKAFSMAESDEGEIPHVVLENAKKVARCISKKSSFAVCVEVEQVNQTINIPIVDRDCSVLSRFFCKFGFIYKV